MRIITDGMTPLSRAVLVDALESDDGRTFEPGSPLLLAAGDRLRFEGDALVVLRDGGVRHDLVGEWSWRCSVRSRTGAGSRAPDTSRETPTFSPFQVISSRVSPR
ncbi:hypothetical protein [Streptomyces aureus]|uniref:hypothetical protein n=1 Tax=Streptomyces aureus TaxID=193461 RepID=UPI0006E45332|nr:hypothetical protein [Streptomyces aureus]